MNYMKEVNLRYKDINDPSISITVTLVGFLFYQTESLFYRKVSKVEIIKGKQSVERANYLSDMYYWDMFGIDHSNLPEFQHAVLVTRYDLYEKDTGCNRMNGISYVNGACIIGRRFSIVQTGDYSLTMRTVAHELGHGLGAVHDGEGVASACKPSDYFLMAPLMYIPNPSKKYTANPWFFSNCSVDTMKTTLKYKQSCLARPGKIFNETEWNIHMKKEPGELYSLDEQCHIANGANSRYCGDPAKLVYVCQFMRCTDPKTGQCLRRNFFAARGTRCQENKWCILGRCFPKN